VNQNDKNNATCYHMSNLLDACSYVAENYNAQFDNLIQVKVSMFTAPTITTDSVTSFSSSNASFSTDS